ncbi:hypothetical protein K488DRAFT_17306, partial [Vararia minispora EC-137]
KHKGFDIRIFASELSFSLRGELLFTAHINECNAAHLDGRTRIHLSAFASFHPSQSALASVLPLNLELWHRRWMHHLLAGFRRAIRDKMVTGVTIESVDVPDPLCEPCLAGKMHAKSFPMTGTVTEQLLALVHAD